MRKTPNPLVRASYRNYLLKKHAEYLDTDTWQGKREYVLRRDNYTCQRCHQYGGKLQVHHKTYKRHGNERVEDLITLCEQCHHEIHKT